MIPHPVSAGTSRRWLGAAIMLCLALATACTAEAPPARHWEKVPFVQMQTGATAWSLELDSEHLESRLIADDRVIAMPPRQLPMKVLALPDDRLLIFARTLFDGHLQLSAFNSDQSWTSIEIPDRLKADVFREAALFNGRLFAVIYNVLTNRNMLYRWSPDQAGQWRFDESFVYELQFNGRYEIASTIRLAVHREALYLAAEGTRYTYDEREGRPNLNRFAWPGTGDMRLLELVSDQQGVVALYQEMGIQFKEGDPAASPHASRFALVDMVTLNAIPDPAVPAGSIPFELRRVDGKIAFSQVQADQDLARLIRHDLERSDLCGLFTLGMNNHEGRVAWSQVYVLNGLIDLLTAWPGHENLFAPLAELRADARARLDIEMTLLDRMLDEGEPGVVSKRYSMHRAPAVYAVQTGRILRLFKRYLALPGPRPMRNFDKLREMTLSLRGHQEQLVTAGPGDPFLPQGRRHLAWPRGCVFPFDGVGIPFNHQDDWAAGVACLASRDELQSEPMLAARDIVRTLIDLEQLDSNPPPDFRWHYWWGRARAGWTAADNVSVNRPSYDGDQGLAHISYRTIDAMAVLTLARSYPELMPPALLDYFTRAVEQDGLYLFACEDLIPHGRLPVVSRELALRSLRIESCWELQNAVWAAAFLAREMTTN